MKKFRKAVAAISGCCVLLAACYGAGAGGKKREVYAASSAEKMFFDDFDAAGFDTRRWEIADSSAKLNKQYNVLRLNLADEWGPAITLRKYLVNGDCTIIFTLTQTSGKGWIGLALGNKSTGDFTKGAKHVLRIEEKAVSLHSADGTGTLNDASADSNRVQDETVRALASDGGKCVVKAELKKRENGKYELRVSAGAEGESLKRIVTYGAEDGKEPEGISADGYIAFCGQNVKADITSFRIEENGDTAFESAFTGGELAYPDESQSGKTWTISGRYGESAAYCGAANRVALSAGSGLVSNVALEKNGGTEKTFDLSFKWYYAAEKMPENTLIGVKFGCDTKENFVGIGKKDGSFALAWCKKSSVAEYISLSSDAVKEGENTVEFCGKFGGALEITINGGKYELKNVDTEGRFAICLRDLSAKTERFEVTEIDDASYVRYVAENSRAESVNNDFSGVKISKIEEADGETEIKEYYINRSAYYVGAEVSLPLLYTEGKKGSLLFSACKNYGYFSPKKEYSEWIMRFDLQVTDERSVKDNGDGTFYLPNLKSGAMIGVSFGKEYVAQSPADTGGIFFYNWYNPEFTEGKSAYTGAEGQNYCGTYLAAANVEKSAYSFGNAPISYDIWGDKSAVYNVMLIAENSTVKLYMKRSEEGAEKMLAPIFTVTGVNTCGYAAIVGLNSASFRISNYSITNISPYRGGNEK